MSVSVKIVSSSSPSIFPISDGMSFEDVCIHCCRDLKILPAIRHLFAVRNEETLLFEAPSDLVQAKTKDRYELRLRFWPAPANLSSIGTEALNYLYVQACNDFVEGRITTFNNKSLQSVALGLSVTAMYCHMQDCRMPMNDVLTNYKRFVPKIVRKNANLHLSVESLKKNLKQVRANPPGETWLCKEQFLRLIIQTAPEYPTERYPVKMDDEEDLVEFDLIIQPLNPDYRGVKLQSVKKKIPNQNVCSIDEICFVSIRRSDNRMEISRINGVPQYFLMASEESMKSCVGALNGYYRLMEKWTFDLCGDLLTPSLVRLKSLKCHGPIGDFFSYEKLRKKRQNKQGCFILRESQTNYDEYLLDVCLEDGQPATTFTITKSSEGLWSFTGLECNPSSSVRQLLATHSNWTDLGIHGFELKECLPSSENDISELLLCRQKPIGSFHAQTSMTQLPVCIPHQSVQLYTGVGTVQYEFFGRFTTVHRGVWRRTPDEQIQIVRKVLKTEFRSAFSNAFLETVQKSMFWRSETIVHMYGIILDANLSLIMEYLPLGPLDKYLKECDLPVIDLVEAATNLAKALFYLEERGVVHGKIRCRNLIIASHSSNSIRVKLADTGILSSLEEELPWIPIELYDSLELVQRKSTADIWACGTCMWEIFSNGDKPCSGLTKSEMMRRFLCGWTLPRPHKCSGEIYHILLATWSPDLRLRPNAHTVMRDINRILYEVYNSRRSNVYEVVNPLHRSLNGSLASGITEATTLRAISEDQDTISFNSHFDDQRFQDTNTSFNIVLSNWAINESSLSMDDEGTSELAAEIYELERDKLELGQMIGQGFYGEVRMGVIRHSDGTAETVAVKKLKSPALNNPENVDLQRECSIMRSLNHPNIVEIKAIVSEPSMLVMEYIPMGSLLAYLRAQKESISDHQLVKFASDVAEGMAYLGENGIVHRDLAARNILVAAEDLVKISDFGLARHVGFNGYYVVRQNAQKLPMPWYAPESLAYWKFSTQSDVWSYGVTLYEMFSRGEEPNFVSGDHNLLLAALQQGRRLPCPPLCPSIIYRELMRPCWDAEASQRPSFTALIGKLRCVETQL